MQLPRAVLAIAKYIMPKSRVDSVDDLPSPSLPTTKANLDIPQDIIDCIIEAVGDDQTLLRTCALVSSSFLLPSRRRLFSNISLKGDKACQRLHQFLVDDVVVQSFIRSIVIDVDHWPWDYSQTHFRSDLELNQSSWLIAVLRLPFRCLETFSIYFSDNRLSWKDLSSELKKTCSTIIHSATLKTLNLHEVVDMPIVLFQGTHLTKLSLNYLSPNDFDKEQSSLLIPTTSKGEATSTPHTVIDHCLWKYFDQVRGPTAPIFLPFMSRLRVFEIYVNPFSASMRDFNILSFVIRSLRVSLTSPATLEHLKFYIVFQACQNGLPSAL